MHRSEVGCDLGERGGAGVGGGDVEHALVERGTPVVGGECVELRGVCVELRGVCVELRGECVELRRRHIIRRRRYIKLRRRHIKLRRRHACLRRNTIQLRGRRIHLRRRSLRKGQLQVLSELVHRQRLWESLNTQGSVHDIRTILENFEFGDGNESNVDAMNGIHPNPNHIARRNGSNGLLDVVHCHYKVIGISLAIPYEESTDYARLCSFTCTICSAVYYSAL